MTMIDVSLHAAEGAAHELQSWLPPEAPLEMPRQALEVERGWRALLAPVLHLPLFRTRA